MTPAAENPGRVASPPRGGHPSRRRVGVTGLGVVTACGAGRGPLREALASGRSPVRAMELFDVSTCRSRTAAQDGALDERPDGAMTSRGWKRLDRASRMLLIAAHEALSEAGLRGRSVDAPLVMATTGGGMRAAEHFHR